MEKESSLSHYNMMNVLSMHALIGAYKPEGYEWTDELCEVLTGNIDFACDYIEKHFEGVTVSKPQGTYMLFVDCTDWCKAHGKTIEDVEHACWDVGAAIQDGTMFFGPCHLRMNLASPRSRIEEAFHRMDKYVLTHDRLIITKSPDQNGRDFFAPNSDRNCPPAGNRAPPPPALPKAGTAAYRWQCAGYGWRPAGYSWRGLPAPSACRR